MIKVYKSNQAFLDEHLQFLSVDDIKHSLIIGIAKKAEGPTSYFVSSMVNKDILVGVIFGKNMIIASNTLQKKVYEDLVTHMMSVDYPGIIGSKDTCLVYQQVFESLTNQHMVIQMNQRIYSCKQIASHYQSEHHIRLAVQNDFSVLKYWYHNFFEEAEGPTLMSVAEKSLQRAIDHKQLYVLEEEEGELLCMTAISRETINSQTIAMVYTPEKYRSKGYASYLVQEMTRLVLENKPYATLYTDLSNPISNRIYMKIGYQAYCDSVMMSIVK